MCIRNFFLKLLFGKEISSLINKIDKKEYVEFFNLKVNDFDKKLEIKNKYNFHIAADTHVYPFEKFECGKGGEIAEGCLLNCGGMDWCNFGGGIKLGDGVYIGPNSVLFGAGGIKIGNNVLISPGVIITSHQHQFNEKGKLIKEHKSEFAEVVIEDDVWIGANAVILPGVRIKKGSVIGAGAVVSKDIEECSVAVGVPAKVIKKRTN